MQDLMINGLLESILDEFNIKQGDVAQYSPLVLAYIGDTVYELFIRTLVVSKGNLPVHKLHKQSVGFVKAKAQSDTVHRLMESLTPEEQEVVRRGRNAKSGTIPKNADVVEYKYATGFESLLGYLYLRKEHERLMQVLIMSISYDRE
jgi:ribonuclease-3 family protein